MNYEYVDNNTRINKSLKNMSPIELIEHKKKLAKERNRRAYIKRKLKKIQEQTSNEVIPYQEEYKDYETSNEVIPYQEEYKDYETITEIVPYEKIDILNGAGTEIIPYEKKDILNGAGTEIIPYEKKEIKEEEKKTKDTKPFNEIKIKIIKTNGPLRITPNIYRKKDYSKYVKKLKKRNIETRRVPKNIFINDSKYPL
tara:strand:- start:580 stop:1173 length:594 start_codon:yes stop_codon:yes gene_type:complete